MRIEIFIEKAVHGGWKQEGVEVFVRHGGIYTFGHRLDTNTMFLDPEAWKAVGKVEGKSGKHVNLFTCNHADGSYSESAEWWKVMMHRMIDALAEGKTIEQYLETL